VVLGDGRVLAATVVPVGAGTTGPGRAIRAVLAEAGLERAAISRTVATGYGRNTLAQADRQVSELSCHARGATALWPGVRTVIDVGGQDAKVLSIDASGRLTSFVMNDKCAAGTGRFLEVIARALELDVTELAQAGASAAAPVEISSTCTVFAESEVISHLAAGSPIADIVAGIHASVASRFAGLARRVAPQPPLVMTGGVANNVEVVARLSERLGLEIAISPRSQLAGALGAALYAQEDATQPGGIGHEPVAKPAPQTNYLTGQLGPCTAGGPARKGCVT
jgi:predicted CoA-substrate-specific enzyme activase